MALLAHRLHYTSDLCAVIIGFRAVRAEYNSTWGKGEVAFFFWNFCVYLGYFVRGVYSTSRCCRMVCSGLGEWRYLKRANDLQGGDYRTELWSHCISKLGLPTVRPLHTDKIRKKIKSHFRDRKGEIAFETVVVRDR